MAVKRKIAEGIIDLVRSPFERTIGPDFDPRFDPRKKERERLESLTVGVDPRGLDVPEVSLQDFEGRPFVTSMSDRTAAGGMLTDVRGRPLESPIDLRGGQDFMFDENAGQVWASGRGPAGAILAAAKRIRRETGENPLFIPWRMAPTGGDFATMTGETMLSFARDNMSKKNKKALDKSLKEVIEGWPGIDSAQAFEAYRNASADARKLAMNSMDVGFRDKGGLSIGEARLAVSDASQLAAQEGGIQNVGTILSEADTTIGRATHPSYPYSVPGEGVGRIKEDVNVFQLLPDIVEQRGIPDPLNPRATDLRSMQMGAKTGRITPEILRNIFGGGAAVGVGAGLMAPEEAEAAGLASLLRMGFPESTARKIASGELSMDPAAKAGRMSEQGFDPEQVFYHGTSSDFMAFRPSTTGEFGPGVYMSTSPVEAGGYAPTNSSRGNAGQNIIPLRAKTEKLFDANARDFWSVFSGATDQEAVEAAKRAGYEGVKYRRPVSYWDEESKRFVDTGDMQEHVVIFDPENVRSVSAAFDPEQTGSSNILAGLGGAGVVGAGLMASDEVSASPLDRPEDVERRANARAVAVASNTLERLRRERGPSVSPLDDTGVYRFGAYLTENRPSEMDPVQRALQSLGQFQGIGEYLRTVGEGQRTTTMQDINAALDIVPL